MSSILPNGAAVVADEQPTTPITRTTATTSERASIRAKIIEVSPQTGEADEIVALLLSLAVCRPTTSPGVASGADLG